MNLFFYLEPDADPRKAPAGEGAFRGWARSYGARFQATVSGFRIGQQILDVVATSSNIERVIIFAHGFPDHIGFQGVNPEGGGISSRPFSPRAVPSYSKLRDFCLLLGPRLAPQPIIGLAACTCAISNAEWRDKAKRPDETPQDHIYRTQYADGGADSFAGLIRDYLCPFQPGVEVRAHKTSGTAHANPSLAFFRSPARSVGRGLCVALRGAMPADHQNLWFQSWRQEWTGEVAAQYITGGPAPAGISPPSSDPGNPNGGTFTTAGDSQFAGYSESSRPANITRGRRFAEIYGEVRSWASQMITTLTGE